ncbi:MAG TPA: DUF932 domain-containing protein [Acidothermaceae bacterium]|nr:DUF932 domain-containing protein [Acidothermaceae bacterium]
MVTSTLINHRGGRDVLREELEGIEPPPPTDTWFPIAHRHVLASVSQTLEGAGFEIKASRLSLSNGDARFFATLDLATPVSDGVTLAVGVRNSTDKSFPIGFCCGTRVFVCDNLAFTSEIVVSKKHTRFGQERYLEGIAQAVGGLNQYKETAGQWIGRLQHWDLSEDAASSYLLRAFETDIIGIRLLPLVLQEWRHPKFEDYKPRTGWSLFNCFTDVLGRTRQARQPAEAALTTMRLSRLLSPPEVIDVQTTALSIG